MSPVSGVCSRLLTFSGVALKTKSLLLFLGAGTFGLYRAAAPDQAASRRRQSPVLFMRLPACGPVCPKFHQVPASVLEQGFFVLLPAGDGTASGGPRGPRAASPEPRRPTADGVAAALPLSLGEYFYPVRVAVPCFCGAGRGPLAKSRPLPLLRLAASAAGSASAAQPPAHRGSPMAAPLPPYRGSKPQTSPSGCRLLAAAKSLANRISPAAGQGSSEKFRAPAGARPQAGANTATASSGRSRELCLAQRSEYASIIPDAPHIQGTARGTPSKYASGPRPAPHIGATATRRSAPIFTRALCGPQGKLVKRKRF